jgi:phosphoribosylglycinamide formyltransferase-1
VVVPELDAGPLLAQVRIPVRPGDDAAALAGRLLPREHALLRATVALLALGRLRIDRAPATLDGRALGAPLQLAANDTLEAS